VIAGVINSIHFVAITSPVRLSRFRSHLLRVPANPLSSNVHGLEVRRVYSLPSYWVPRTIKEMGSSFKRNLGTRSPKNESPEH